MIEASCRSFGSLIEVVRPTHHCKPTTLSMSSFTVSTSIVTTTTVDGTVVVVYADVTLPVIVTTATSTQTQTVTANTSSSSESRSFFWIRSKYKITYKAALLLLRPSFRLSLILRRLLVSRALFLETKNPNKVTCKAAALPLLLCLVVFLLTLVLHQVLGHLQLVSL